MKKDTKFVAEITCYGNGNVGIKKVDGNSKQVLLDDVNADGTMLLKKSGDGEFVKAKKGTGRHRERDKIIKRTVSASLAVSPSGSRVKVNISLDREQATEDSFLQSLLDITDTLSDDIYDYLTEAPQPPKGEFF